jgi:hypothetical protein
MSLIENGLIPDSAAQEFYLLQSKIFYTVDVFDFTRWTFLCLFPKGWKLNHFAIDAHDSLLLRFSIEFSP